MAVITLTTQMAGAINYTATTASSSDWASVSNNTYFYDLTDKLVYYKNSSGTVLSVFSVGGLTYFTEAQNSSAPNATVNVDSLTAVASTTDADISFVPKGAGAFQLAIPDSTTTGGNKRGQYAVDLQMSRSANTQVAGGSYSFTAGSRNSATDYSVGVGYNNSVGGTFNASIGHDNVHSGAVYGYSFGRGNTVGASATNSFVAGFNNTVSANGSTALGISNLSSGAYSTVAGGQGNTASGTYSFCGGGSNNTASGSYAVAMGQSCTSSYANSVAIGYNDIASNLYAVALGSSNTASGNSSIALGYRAKATGQNSICLGTYDYSDTTASGKYSVAVGVANVSSGQSSVTVGGQNNADASYSMSYGYSANTFGITGKISYSSYNITTNGDVQDGNIRLIGRTTDATPKTLNTINTTLINPGTQLTLQNQQLMRFKGSVTGKQQTSTNVGVWDIDGVIVRGANAGTTTLVISNVNLVTNASGWGTPVLSVDTTNGCLSVQVTGLAGTNIQWQVSINTVENLYA